MTTSKPRPRPEDDTDEQARRQRAERLLGGLLPDQTSDENPAGWGDGETESRDAEIQRDVPPHHGG